jgi:hypothetical protein
MACCRRWPNCCRLQEKPRYIRKKWIAQDGGEILRALLRKRSLRSETRGVWIPKLWYINTQTAIAYMKSQTAIREYTANIALTWKYIPSVKQSKEWILKATLYKTTYDESWRMTNEETACDTWIHKLRYMNRLHKHYCANMKINCANKTIQRMNTQGGIIQDDRWQIVWFRPLLPLLF